MKWKRGASRCPFSNKIIRKLILKKIKNKKTKTGKPQKISTFEKYRSSCSYNYTPEIRSSGAPERLSWGATLPRPLVISAIRNRA